MTLGYGCSSVLAYKAKEYTIPRSSTEDLTLGYGCSDVLAYKRNKYRISRSCTEDLTLGMGTGVQMFGRTR